MGIKAVKPRRRPHPPVAHPRVAAQRVPQVQAPVVVAQVQQRFLVWSSIGWLGLLYMYMYLYMYMGFHNFGRCLVFYGLNIFGVCWWIETAISLFSGTNIAEDLKVVTQTPREGSQKLMNGKNDDKQDGPLAFLNGAPWGVKGPTLKCAKWVVWSKLDVPIIIAGYTYAKDGNDCTW